MRKTTIREPARKLTDKRGSVTRVIRPQSLDHGKETKNGGNIVADYMKMLADDLAGRVYGKAAHNRSLQQLIGRGRRSIEYKHQNISAVLKGLGETWVEGYKPAFNFQTSLVDAVERWLDQKPGWYSLRPARIALSTVHDAPALWIGTAPTLSDAPPPDEADQMARIAAGLTPPNAITATAN